MSEAYFRTYAEINLEYVRRNAECAKNLLPQKTGLIAVVKTDAYGHGAVQVAKAVSDIVWGYAVATVDEAVELRENGIDKPILILGYVSPHEYETVIMNGIIVAVFTYEQAETLSKKAEELAESTHDLMLKAKCHIKIDTGMNRIGFEAKDDEHIMTSAAVIEQIKKLDYLEADGIFMHFAKADVIDKKSALEQYEHFMKLIHKLENDGVKFKYKHCSNSAAIIDLPQVTLDLARQGITLYGLFPSDEVNKRRTMVFPAMSLKSHVVHIKEVKKGWGISYGYTFVADRDMKVATVCAGYGDGYPRSLSNKGEVLIHGKRAKILGRICMDQMMVDVTDIPDVQIEDIVTLVGRDGNECITVEELGNLSGRFNYEFVCDINKRVKRIYLNSRV